jgi:hypothetical protein
MNDEIIASALAVDCVIASAEAFRYRKYHPSVTRP